MRPEDEKKITAAAETLPDEALESVSGGRFLHPKEQVLIRLDDCEQQLTSLKDE